MFNLFFHYYKMFRPNVARPVIRPRGGGTSGSGRRFALLGMMMLLFLLVVVVLLIILLKRRKDKKRKKYKKLSEKTREEVNQNIRNAAEELGMDPDELEREFNEQVEEQARQDCMVNPLRAGQCSPNYTLENGCCYPDESAPPSRAAAQVEFLKELSISLGAGMIIEAMLAVAIHRARTGATGARAAATGARASATATRATASTARATTAATKAARAAAAAARAAAAAAKAAAAAGKYAIAAASGPAGWIAMAVMIVFDVISIILDATDSGGYASETKNSLLNRTKNVFDYETAKALELEGIEYPLLFPLGVVYPEEFQAALEFGIIQTQEQHMLDELRADENMLDIVADFNDDLDVNPDAEVPEEFINFLAEIPKKFHLDRDKYIFQKLQELLGADANKIDIYESLSTPDRVAVTFTQVGVQEWNDSKKETWFANNDLFKPEDPPPMGEDPLAALYTDTYYVYDSGPSDNPVMVPRKLGEKTALAAVYGPLVAFCEKSRKVQSSSPTINPRDLGVKFDYETGVCNFTKEYCRRYGLEFKNNDCKMGPGQGVAELIFGQTITS